MTGVRAISESTSHSGGLNYLHADGEKLWGPGLASCMHIAVEADAGSMDRVLVRREHGGTQVAGICEPKNLQGENIMAKSTGHLSAGAVLAFGFLSNKKSWWGPL